MHVYEGCLIVIALSLVLLSLYQIKELGERETVFEELLRLSVGGKHFTTTKTTLLREKDSLFGLLATLPKDNGAYFIDRDPELFSYVLEYLRTGTISHILTLELRDSLVLEANFFGLQGLKKIVQPPFNKTRAGVKKWIAQNAETFSKTFSRLGEQNYNTITMTQFGKGSKFMVTERIILSKNNGLGKPPYKIDAFPLRIVGTNKSLFTQVGVSIMKVEFAKTFSINFYTEYRYPDSEYHHNPPLEFIVSFPTKYLTTQ